MPSTKQKKWFDPWPSTLTCLTYSLAFFLFPLFSLFSPLFSLSSLFYVTDGGKSTLSPGHVLWPFFLTLLFSFFSLSVIYRYTPFVLFVIPPLLFLFLPFSVPITEEKVIWSLAIYSVFLSFFVSSFLSLPILSFALIISRLHLPFLPFSMPLAKDESNWIPGHLLNFFILSPFLPFLSCLSFDLFIILIPHFQFLPFSMPLTKEKK